MGSAESAIRWAAAQGEAIRRVNRTVDIGAAAGSWFLAADGTHYLVPAAEYEELLMAKDDGAKTTISKQEYERLTAAEDYLNKCLEYFKKFRYLGAKCDAVWGPCACGAWHHPDKELEELLEKARKWDEAKEDICDEP